MRLRIDLQAAFSEFRYTDPFGTVTTVRLLPRALRYHAEGHWVLDAYDGTSGGDAAFLLDSLEPVK